MEEGGVPSLLSREEISPSDRIVLLINQLPRYGAFDSWFPTTTTTSNPSPSANSDTLSLLETCAKKCEAAVSLVKIKCHRKILPESPEVWIVYFQPFPTQDLFLCSENISSQHVDDLNELIKSGSFRLCSKSRGGNEVEYHDFCEDEYLTESYLKRGMLPLLFLKYLRESGRIRGDDPEANRWCEEKRLFYEQLC